MMLQAVLDEFQGEVNVAEQLRQIGIFKHTEDPIASKFGEGTIFNTCHVEDDGLESEAVYSRFEDDPLEIERGEMVARLQETESRSMGTTGLKMLEWFLKEFEGSCHLRLEKNPAAKVLHMEISLYPAKNPGEVKCRRSLAEN